jgi:uncharacterized membrane protein
LRQDRTSTAVLLLLAAVAAAQMVHYYPLLPESIAVHFGNSGEPNGWSDKTDFVMTYGATELFVVLLGLVSGLLLSKTPPALVNIPHRDYWLDPERRQETVAFLSKHVIWMETVTVAFLVAIAQLVFKANLGGSPPRLSGDFWYIFAAFIGAIAWLTVKIVLRFRTREEPPLG